MLDPFAQFNRRHDVSQSDIDALSLLKVRERTFEPGSTIVHPDEWSAHSVVVLEGFIGRSKTTDSGMQQMLSIYIVGDIPDLSALFLPTLDSDLLSIGRTKVGFVRRESLIELLSARPGLVAAVCRDISIDLSITREWLFNVGQRSAEQRIALSSWKCMIDLQ